MSEFDYVQRRSRILAIQKKTLVQLIENHFIRSFGYDFNVSFETIDMTIWEKFATILNKLGPAKTAAQWKNSFACMNTRVRNKVALNRKSNANPENKLSALDLQIYKMLPNVDYEIFNFSNGNEEQRQDYGNQHHADMADAQVTETVDKFSSYAEMLDRDDEYQAGTAGVKVESRRISTRDETTEEYAGVFRQANDYHDGTAGVQIYSQRISASDETTDEYLSYEEMLQRDKENHAGMAGAKDDSRLVLVALDVEELESCANDTAVEGTCNENSTVDIGYQYDGPDTSCFEIERGNTVNPALTSRPKLSKALAPARSNNIRSVDFSTGHSTDEVIYIEDEPYVANKFAKPIITPRSKLSEQLAQAPRNNSKSREAAKTSARIPDIQKERLVQLVQNNFLKIVGRFAGSNGVHIKTQLWQNIAKELNTLGPARTSEQWKATFNGIKASAKAKLANGHNDDNGTVSKSLNRLEEKIVAIYGLDSLDGDQQLGEAGFIYEKTIPTRRHLNRPEGSQVCSTVTSGELESLSRNHKQSETPYSRRQKNYNDNYETEHTSSNDLNGFGLGPEKPRPASREEESALEDILREIREETSSAHDSTSSFGPQHETEMGQPSLTTAGNAVRSTTSKTGLSQTAAKISDQSQIRGRPLQNNAGLPNGVRALENSFPPNPPPNNRQLSRGQTSTIARIRDESDGRASPISRNIRVPPARVRYSSFHRVNVDYGDEEEPEEPIVRPNRDRSNLRNRYTSYDMVQRSIQQQEHFIEQNDRNHAELIYTSDRNHSQMIGMFNSTLQTLADVARDIFKK